MFPRGNDGQNLDNVHILPFSQRQSLSISFSLSDVLSHFFTSSVYLSISPNLCFCLPLSNITYHLFQLVSLNLSPTLSLSFCLSVSLYAYLCVYPSVSVSFFLYQSLFLSLFLSFTFCPSYFLILFLSLSLSLSCLLSKV